MVATVALNPFATTNAAGSFNTTSNGLIQGTAYDSPNSRYNLAGGILASSETIPMWGGVAIYEQIPGVTPGPVANLGSIVGRATNITAQNDTAIQGWSVFDQAYHGITSPGNPVPLIPSYGSVHFYRLGSGARIAVACSPNLVTAEGHTIAPLVSWNFGLQLLEATGTPGTLASLTTYNSSTGLVTVASAAPHGYLPGDVITVSGVTGTGADIATLNGTQTLLAGTTGSTLVWQGGTGLTISSVTGGAFTSGAALAGVIKVLDVQIGNSMTVNYNATTGATSWNRSGNCAVILL